MVTTMNNIEAEKALSIKQLIDLDNCGAESYFELFIKKALDSGLISSIEAETIQMQTVEILIERINRYTHYESSSVRTEVAQDIMQSILYTIGFYLKSLPDTSYALIALKENRLRDLFQKGNRQIKEQVNKAKLLWYVVRSSVIRLDNLAYCETITNGIAGFFLNYDYEFAAHHTPGIIDYPLAYDKMDLVGIEYMYIYLKKLYWEHSFCAKFPESTIDKLFRQQADYQSLLVNIFELVFINAIAARMLRKPVTALNITEAEREYLQKNLESLSQDELGFLLQKVAYNIFLEFGFNERDFWSYIKLITSEIAVRLKNNLETKTLQVLFIGF